MTETEPNSLESDAANLARYYHDCLAAQTRGARTVNIFEQKDVAVLGLTAQQQRTLGSQSALNLSSEIAVEFGNRVTTSGSDVEVKLGAMFILGTIPASGDRTERRIFAPLLTIPIQLSRNAATSSIQITPEESEFALNYSLFAELMYANEDDLSDRLSELAELVPDFPIDETEFQVFWNGFRMIFPEVTISETHDQSRTTRIAKPVSESPSSNLNMVDFKQRRIPTGPEFELLAAAALTVGQRSGPPMSALHELHQLASMPVQGTAFETVFARRSAIRHSVSGSDDFALPVPLTPVQKSIVQSARTAPLTVVTGPPGTGKSYTITAVVLDAFLRGESVLVASQMDKAVEVVAENLKRVTGPYSMARSGGRSVQRELADEITKLTGPLREIPDVSRSERRRAAQTVTDDLTRLERLESRFRQTIDEERRWQEYSDSVRRREPLSTLPVFDLDDAAVVKAARAVRRMSRDTKSGWFKTLLCNWQLKRARRLLRVPDNWETDHVQLQELSELQTLRCELRNTEAQLRSLFPADALGQEIERVYADVHRASVQLVKLTRWQQLRRVVTRQTTRTELRHLATMLRRRKRKLKQQLQEKISAAALLAAFPAWGCTNRTLCEILPLTPGLFDLVIIDEASQCDPALAALALMRAKRAVIVGDPRQLRHVCFLSRAQEHAAFTKYRISPQQQEKFHYRRSIFDIASDVVQADQFFLLDEHFRSHPHIIGFSNRRFYDRQLKVMTDTLSSGQERRIQIRRVAGIRKPDSSINLTEIEDVVSTIRMLISNSHSEHADSIGVVSPFRDHVDAIREKLLSTLHTEDMEKHEIVVGTAHSLQGDEKDVVIFTTSIDQESHPASLRFLESPNLFNVAVTRARESLIVITSVDPSKLPAGLLRDYLHYAETSPEETLRTPKLSQFAQTVFDRLTQQQLEVHTASIASRCVLVGVHQTDNRCAILIDDLSAAASDDRDPLVTQLRLYRCGWKTLRITPRAWARDWVECCNRVRNAFDQTDSQAVQSMD